MQPLSRDHHTGLLLCFKIREGLKNSIDPLRIKAYADWSWEQELTPHFKLEEQFVFPLLGQDHPLIQQALKEHLELERLFAAKDDILETLRQIEAKLKQHIRFEERVLFNEIQEKATPEQLAKIESAHAGVSGCELWHDKFW